jgi:hypothetical protein
VQILRFEASRREVGVYGGRGRHELRGVAILTHMGLSGRTPDAHPDRSAHHTATQEHAMRVRFTVLGASATTLIVLYLPALSEASRLAR